MAREVSAWKLGGLTPGELVAGVRREIQKDEISDRAAALSYYFLFALFPALLFLTALLMLWLYLTGIVLLLGAEVNSEIEFAAAQRGDSAKLPGERAPGEHRQRTAA